jgi:hypothetical protein
VNPLPEKPVESATPEVHRELADALEAVAEHERLTARIARAELVLHQASAACVTARTEHEKEVADVTALESFSPARIWATLSGERETRLSREQAEQQAAAYAVARAEAEVERARRELDAARGDRSELGDVTARREAALAAVEHWHRTSGSSQSRELSDLALELGTVRSQLAEVREALSAANAARRHLQEAEAMLGKARDWASYDTFFGGGLLTDAMKYDRVESAERLLRDADQALARLATELADVDMATTARVDIDGLTRTFDVWFDNVFTDWSVRTRIAEAHDRTRTALGALDETGRALESRERDLVGREAAAVERREQLLLPR